MSKHGGLGIHNLPFGSTSSAQQNDDNNRTQNSGQSDTVNLRSGEILRLKGLCSIKAVRRYSHRDEITVHSQIQHDNPSQSLAHVNPILIEKAMAPCVNRAKNLTALNDDQLRQFYEKSASLRSYKKRSRNDKKRMSNGSLKILLNDNPINASKARSARGVWQVNENIRGRSSSKNMSFLQVSRAKKIAQNAIKNGRKIDQSVAKNKAANTLTIIQSPPTKIRSPKGNHSGQAKRRKSRSRSRLSSNILESMQVGFIKTLDLYLTSKGISKQDIAEAKEDFTLAFKNGGDSEHIQKIRDQLSGYGTKDSTESEKKSLSALKNMFERLARSAKKHTDIGVPIKSAKSETQGPEANHLLRRKQVFDHLKPLEDKLISLDSSRKLHKDHKVWELVREMKKLYLGETKNLRTVGGLAGELMLDSSLPPELGPEMAKIVKYIDGLMRASRSLKKRQ